MNEEGIVEVRRLRGISLRWRRRTGGGGRRRGLQRRHCPSRHRSLDPNCMGRGIRERNPARTSTIHTRGQRVSEKQRWLVFARVLGVARGLHGLSQSGSMGTIAAGVLHGGTRALASRRACFVRRRGARCEALINSTPTITFFFFLSSQLLRLLLPLLSCHY